MERGSRGLKDEELNEKRLRYEPSGHSNPSAPVSPPSRYGEYEGTYRLQ